MNIASLLSVLKRAGGNDKATISLLDSKLEIVLQNSSKRRFTIPLLDISQEEVPPIDQLQFDTKAEIKSDILQRGIEDAEVVSDSVLFEASEDSFFMKAEGDISSAHLELEKGSQSLISIKTNGDTRARYPVDYLKKMIKATKIADKVILEWSKDYPMKLTFNSEDKISLNMILAPRVTEE